MRASGLLEQPATQRAATMSTEKTVTVMFIRSRQLGLLGARTTPYAAHRFGCKNTENVRLLENMKAESLSRRCLSSKKQTLVPFF